MSDILRDLTLAIVIGAVFGVIGARCQDEDRAGRIYHTVTRIVDLSKSTWTHVEVEGEVTLVKREADGDIHIRISNAAHSSFCVAEIIPTLAPAKPFPMPHKGDWVRVRGIRRQDTAGNHGWPEVHPVESLEVVQLDR